MPNADFHLLFVIATIGKRNECLVELVQSILDQTDSAFSVGICDQSGGLEVLEALSAFPENLVRVTTSAAGLSNARNAVIAAFGGSATHYAFPNDTSRLATNFTGQIRDVARDERVAVIACRYTEAGMARYEFESGLRVATMNSVWQILEPAMVLSRGLYTTAGGFDAELGTGAPTPWQSGEGTDLLLRIARQQPVHVAWANWIEVYGVPQGYGLSLNESCKKCRAYGRGFGFVLKRHDYPLTFKVRSVLGPILRGIMGFRSERGRMEFATATGRLEGLFHHVVGRPS